MTQKAKKTPFIRTDTWKLKIESLPVEEYSSGKTPSPASSTSPAFLLHAKKQAKQNGHTTTDYGFKPKSEKPIPIKTVKWRKLTLRLWVWVKDVYDDFMKRRASLELIEKQVAPFRKTFAELDGWVKGNVMVGSSSPTSLTPTPFPCTTDSGEAEREGQTSSKLHKIESYSNSKTTLFASPACWIDRRRADAFFLQVEERAGRGEWREIEDEIGVGVEGLIMDGRAWVMEMGRDMQNAMSQQVGKNAISDKHILPEESFDLFAPSASPNLPSPPPRLTSSPLPRLTSSPCTLNEPRAGAEGEVSWQGIRLVVQAFCEGLESVFGVGEICHEPSNSHEPNSLYADFEKVVDKWYPEFRNITLKYPNTKKAMIVCCLRAVTATMAF